MGRTCDKNGGQYTCSKKISRTSEKKMKQLNSWLKHGEPSITKKKKEEKEKGKGKREVGSGNRKECT